MSLTERQKGILELLRQKKLLTIEQLEYFHPDFGYQKQSRFLAQRDINKLHQFFLVDKIYQKVLFWDEQKRMTEIIALGKMGSQFVGWKDHHERIQEFQGKRFLGKKAYHILRVNDLEIQSREVLNRMNVEIQLWASECGLSIVKDENKLNPDAFCLMYDQETEHYYSLFVEYDTGKDDFGYRLKFPSLAEKFNKYRQVKIGTRWYQNVFSQSSLNKFPYLFFVTEEPKRFPKLPELLKDRDLRSTVCMKGDYTEKLEEFVHQMREMIDRETSVS